MVLQIYLIRFRLLVRVDSFILYCTCDPAQYRLGQSMKFLAQYILSWTNYWCKGAQRRYIIPCITINASRVVNGSSRTHSQVYLNIYQSLQIVFELCLITNLIKHKLVLFEPNMNLSLSYNLIFHNCFTIFFMT